MDRQPDSLPDEDLALSPEAGAGFLTKLRLKLLAPIHRRRRHMMIPSRDVLMVLYRSLLGREPDEAGVRHYLRLLRSEEKNLQEIVQMLVSSEEALTQLGSLRPPTWLLQTTALHKIREQAWRSKMDRRRPVFFMHILKTGGTTLRDALIELVEPDRRLTDLFLDQFVALPDYVLPAMTLVAGHLPYEAVELMPKDVAVCTVIRDPVERTLSHYWHLRATAPDPITLETFVRSSRYRTARSNYQARQLVHRIGIADAWEGFSPRGRLGEPGTMEVTPLQSLFDTLPMSVPDEQLRDEALARLAQIEFVGVTEELPRVAAAIAELWEVDPPHVGRKRVARGRPEAADVPRELVDRIREENAVDQALYEAARARSEAGVRTR